MGITYGCNPPQNTLFCPGDDLSRGEMAAFLVRAYDLPATDANPFTDIDQSEFHHDITALAASGITHGCNPPENDRFCPHDSVTRGEMAAFLTRANDYEATGPNPFEDTADSVFVDDITAIAEAGVTLGCNPPENSRFCPGHTVTREQMASFIVRTVSP